MTVCLSFVTVDEVNAVQNLKKSLKFWTFPMRWSHHRQDEGRVLQLYELSVQLLAQVIRTKVRRSLACNTVHCNSTCVCLDSVIRPSVRPSAAFESQSEAKPAGGDDNSPTDGFIPILHAGIGLGLPLSKQVPTSYCPSHC